MPRFAANLSFLYTEVPFLDRFAAAAHDGFRGVEFGFGYDFTAKAIAARLSAHVDSTVAAPLAWRAAPGSSACSLRSRENS